MLIDTNTLRAWLMKEYADDPPANYELAEIAINDIEDWEEERQAEKEEAWEDVPDNQKFPF
jgi:hypothetical protein